jgi:hypothetical protein
LAVVAALRVLVCAQVALIFFEVRDIVRRNVLGRRFVLALVLDVDGKRFPAVELDRCGYERNVEVRLVLGKRDDGRGRSEVSLRIAVTEAIK